MKNSLKHSKKSALKTALIINPKKSAIFLFKGHKKIEGNDIDEIPIKECDILLYLGIKIDDGGEVLVQVKTIRNRSEYLRANMRYYTHNLRFERTSTSVCPST